MRIAHLSDLHVLALENVGVGRFLNKRLTGYANLRFKRNHIHRPGHVRAILREVARLAVDHVVITGDLTNLALETEFEAALEMIRAELGFPAPSVSVVPGNHDFYTRGAERSGRFLHYFRPFTTSDLELGDKEAFPFVRFRGPLAIIGLNTALARAPLFANGKVGDAQLARLARILAHPELRRRVPVILAHHPIYNPERTRRRIMTGLEDALNVNRALTSLEEGVFLHGHLHTRAHRVCKTSAGRIDIIGATSASLQHEDGERTAGFNVYQFAPNGFLAGVEAHILETDKGTFRIREIPKANVELSLVS